MSIFETLLFEASERIKQIGHRVLVVRTRRRWSIAEAAAKAGINWNTLGALELGKPGVAIGAYALALGYKFQLRLVKGQGQTIPSTRTRAKSSRAG